MYRIFSHAYFHHRSLFDEFEVLSTLKHVFGGCLIFDFPQNETFLCRRFTEFVMRYNLMSKEILIVPILEVSGGLSYPVESEA